MPKKVSSIRFSETCLQKLEQLIEIEKNAADRYHVEPKSRSEIIEEAVNEYYTMKLDNDSGSEYLTRMNLMIRDALKQQGMLSDAMLNSILKYSMCSYEAAITLLKYLRLPDSSMPEDGIEAVQFADSLIKNSTSIFEESILEKVTHRLQEGDE